MRPTVWAGLAALAAGCGGGGGRVPAAGTVTLDGAPVGGAVVMFLPDDDSPGQGGYATTDPAGRFEIDYPGTGKGLIPGTYRVTVNRPPAGADLIDAPVRAGAGVPGRYASPEGTPLRVKVEPGGAPLEVKLVTGKK